MTRFEREISGSLGAFWEKHAQEEVKKAVAKADAEAEVDADGAIRWNCNGRYLMDDFCEMLEYAGYPFSRETTGKSGRLRMRKNLLNTAGTIKGWMKRSLQKHVRLSVKGQRLWMS